MFKINIRTIEKLMHDNSLTLSRLSENSGVPKSVLSKMLNGVTAYPNPETVHTLCEYFDVPLSSIVEKSDNVFVEPVFDRQQLRNNVLRLMLQTSIVSSYELHRKSGIAHKNIERIIQENSESKPHTKTLYDLANFFDITVSQLKGYEPLPPFDSKIKHKENLKIPLLEISNVRNFVKGKISKETITSYINQYFENDHRFYAVIIKSDKYFPAFKAGNIIIIDENSKPYDGDYIIACINDDDTDIFEYIADDVACIKSINKDHIYNVNEVEIFGVIVEIKLKII